MSLAQPLSAEPGVRPSLGGDTYGVIPTYLPIADAQQVRLFATVAVHL